MKKYFSLSAVLILSIILACSFFGCKNNEKQESKESKKKTEDVKKTNQIRFTGEKVLDKATGLAVTADESGSVIAVTNSKYHYGLILPYSKEWVFDCDIEGHLLRGNSGLMNVTVDLTEYSGTPESYLEEHKDYLNEPGRVPGLVDSQIIPRNDFSVLKTKLDLGQVAEEQQGKVQLNYFIAKKWENELYMLHYSDIIEEAKIQDYNEEDIFNQLEFFKVDFLREES